MTYAVPDLTALLGTLARMFMRAQPPIGDKVPPVLDPLILGEALRQFVLWL